MDLLRDLWKPLLYRSIGIIITAVFALLVGLYCTEIESKAVVATIVAMYLIGIFFYISVEEYRRVSQSEIVEQAERVERQSRLLMLTREGNLLCTASAKIADVLKEIAYQYSEITAPGSLNWETGQAGWIYNQKRLILQNICEVLMEDRKEYSGPTDYFKATLFTVSSPDLLELNCSYYPPGMEPRTEKIERPPKVAVPTAFHCLDTESIQVIPNVPEELRKGANSRWVELWPGQSQHYGSMVCVPICLGERATHTLKVIAILTIDTNRLDYFPEQEEERNFLARLLAPFRAELSFIYSAESLFAEEQNDTRSE